MPVDYSVSALANLIHHDLRSLATHTHTHTLSYREYTHNRTEHTTFFLPNTIHTIHHCPSDVIRNSTRLTYSQPRPFLPSFSPSFKQTHHSLFFFPSTQNHTTPERNTTQTRALRFDGKPPPFFEFPRENPRNAGAPCFFPSRISDSIQWIGLAFGSDRSMRWYTWLGSYIVSSCILLNTFFGRARGRE